MAKKDYPVRDDFIRKKKIGPDKLKEAKPDSKTRLMLFLEKARIVIYFIMNVVLDFIKKYEAQKPIYEKILKVLKELIKAASKLFLLKR